MLAGKSSTEHSGPVTSAKQSSQLASHSDFRTMASPSPLPTVEALAKEWSELNYLPLTQAAGEFGKIHGGQPGFEALMLALASVVPPTDDVPGGILAPRQANVPKNFKLHRAALVALGATNAHVDVFVSQVRGLARIFMCSPPPALTPSRFPPVPLAGQVPLTDVLQAGARQPGAAGHRRRSHRPVDIPLPQSPPQPHRCLLRPAPRRRPGPHARLVEVHEEPG